ncbi:MAG: PEP-CTERM sorting domain-containing protein, partial [Verrucomicrobiae bacterium]|nr:PEP-CTERM sorting domain-containing protein [Verrucomicrobiae bacterium]
QEVELKLVNYALPDGAGAGVAYIDSLTFSSTVTVPEPSVCALLGIGGLGLLWALWFGPKHRSRVR